MSPEPSTVNESFWIMSALTEDAVPLLLISVPSTFIDSEMLWPLRSRVAPALTTVPPAVAERVGRADAPLDDRDGARAVVDAPAEAAVAVEGDGCGRRVVVGHAAATGKPAAGEREAVEIKRAVDGDRAASQRTAVPDANG